MSSNLRLQIALNLFSHINRMASAHGPLDKLLLSSGLQYTDERSFAERVDSVDPLHQLREQFSFPTKERVWPNGHAQTAHTAESEGSERAVYLAGNSLGLMPKSTPALLQQELDVWSTT